MTEAADSWTTLPEPWRPAIRHHLEAGETLLAWFEPDLDDRLQYSRHLVVLTDRRLLELSADDAEGRSWNLTPDGTLQARERGGVGALEWLGPNGQLGLWRYTAGLAPAARRFVQRRETHPTGMAPPSSICPNCGGPMAADGTCPACAVSAEPRSFATLFRLLQFTRQRTGLIVLGFVLTLTSTAVGLLPPYLTMPLLDDVLIPNQNGQPTNFALVYWYLAGLFGAALLAWLLDWARSGVLSWVSERVSADLRQRTFAHLQQLSVEFFGGQRTGDLIARISSDTDRLCNFLSSHLIDLATDTLMIVMTAAVLLSIDPLLALATLSPFPVILMLVTWARNRLQRGYSQGNVAWAEMTSILADTIPGIRVVKAFAQERREVERFRDCNRRVLHTNDRVNFVWAFFGSVVTFLTTLGLLVVWACAAWRVYAAGITVGVLTAFLAYIARFYSGCETLIRMYSDLERAAASARRIFEILDRVPSVPEPAQPIDPGRVQGRIELRNVRFRYGTREVLHGLNLTVQPGEMIGLVGPSGAGKTTLINLVCRFFDVAGGSLLVDGTDVRSFRVAAYRRNVGIVLQEPFLFYGSIAENIAYGRPDATHMEIVAAARAARAHEFILRLPDGYDSLVGERGQSLSGGERQRISIARALLIDPRILILDEATSSVDTETERAIQAALENLVRGRTTIAIAHRLSTLRKADRIVVLDQGHIVEIGAHHELLRANGTYARLHRAQMEAIHSHTV